MIKRKSNASWDNKCELGLMGELMVRDYLLSEGCRNVVLSENRFDDKKDLVADGTTVEVKTFIRFFKYDSFLLEESQWKKIDGVGRFFIVELPIKSDSINIWEVKNKALYRIINLNDRRNRCYNVENLTLHSSVIDTDKAQIMRVLSPTTYRPKEFFNG